MVHVVKYKETGDRPWFDADVSVGQLAVDQLVMRATRRTTLGISLVKPEPHDRSVVLLAWGEGESKATSGQSITCPLGNTTNAPIASHLQRQPTSRLVLMPGTM